MTYALVNDIHISWATYEDVAGPALEDMPTGLIIHVAGPTDEGVRIIDIWETEQEYRSFQAERLQPLLAGRVDAPAASVFRELQVQHIVASAERGRP